MLFSTDNPEPLDLLAASRTPRLRSQLMENLCEVIMRKIGFLMFQRMRCKMQMLSYKNAVVSHDAALSSFPDLSFAAVVDLAPFDTRAILAIEGDLIGAVVDEACGSTSKDMFARDELSVMEGRFGKQMIDVAMQAIRDVLGHLTPVGGAVVQYETSRAMLSIDESQAWMVMTTGKFESTLGQGSIKLIIPYLACESLEAKISSRGSSHAGEEERAWLKALDRMVDQVPVEVRFEIGRARVPMHELESIQAGQNLPCVCWPHAVAYVDETEVFQADYGQSNGYVSCRVKGDESTSDRLKRGLRPASNTIQRRIKGGILSEMPIVVTAELGRTALSVVQLSNLHEGLIVHLNEVAGEPIRIFANGRPFGYGEAVPGANDRCGIRFLRHADEDDEVVLAGVA